MTQPAFDPFDPSQAASPTVVVPLSRIVDPLGRRPHDPGRIDAYRLQMLADARFPPISVVTWGSRYLVADGHKRLAAYATLGRPEIRVEIWSWSRWLGDQARQAKDNAGKNAQILRLSVTDPPAARRLLASTIAHWRRVAEALVASVRARP